MTEIVEPRVTVAHLYARVRRRDITRRPVSPRTILHSAAALLVLLAAGLVSGWPPAPTQASAPTIAAMPRPAAAAPAVSPLIGTPDYLPLSMSEAAVNNAAVPIAALPNPSAARFLAAAGTANEARALECLTAAIYFEAASESVQGRRAVAQVVLNRVRHPAFPKSVCGVVFQGAMRAGSAGCQFTFTCDGALARARALRPWAEARAIAAQALAGYVEPSVGLATHYHTVEVVPYWRDSLIKTAVIGSHIFYRWGGEAGQPSAFTGRYAGGERSLDDLVRTAAVATPSAAPAVAEPVAAVPAPAASPVQVPAAAKAGLAFDLNGMAEVESGPRIVLPHQEPAKPAPLAANEAPAIDG